MALDLSALDTMVAPIGNKPDGRAPTAPPSQFVEDPDQPRIEFEEDAEYLALVEDIRRRGILQPVIVHRLASGKLQLRFGARRLRAATAAGLTQIKYIETDDERQFDDYAQVSENQFHKPLQPLELAQFIARKIAAGEKKKQVAAALQLDPSAVTHLLALVYDPPTLLLELYHSRRCRAPHLLYALRKLSGLYGAALDCALSDGAEVDRQRLDAISAALTAGAVFGLPTASAGSEVVEQSVAEDSSGKKARSSAKPAAAMTGSTTNDGSALPGADAAADQASPTKTMRLLGNHQGMSLELLLDRAPQEDGRCWVRYLDADQVIDVAIGEIALTCFQYYEELPAAMGECALAAGAEASKIS